ncbi:hypothetical protein Lepto7375DRAFT_0190 [Leptolyngbya sp. PCC 7375]|nr:hypothetical protein Lepto7375DRAFT_0190 [Leptolyngbya sp. PCC 7375]
MYSLSCHDQSEILLPFLVALSEAGGTAAVWFAPDKPQQDDVQLSQTVEVLEERIMNLETIYVSLPEVDQPLLLTETDT